MTDINIIANGNLASLLAIEAERMGVSYKVTASPIKSARVYVADLEICNKEKLDKEKTIAVNSSENDGFACSLRWPFLLSEFKRIAYSLLFDTVKQESKREDGEKRLVISVEPESRCAVIDGKRISLSPTEYIIFDALVKRRGETVSCEELGELINRGKSNKINVHVCLLRKKLEADGTKIIYSVRGKGFIVKE